MLEAETSTDGNRIVTASLNQWQTRFTAFLGDTNQTTLSGGDASSEMVVTQILTRAAPKPGQEIGTPLTGVGRKVNSLTVDPLLATQRRRLRG
jgi:hypothetical protein